jgi:hypothetical protein
MVVPVRSAMMIVFRSDAVGPAERREEAQMINLTDIENRRADVAAKIDRVNRAGWMHDAPAPSGTSRRLPMVSVGLTLERIGGTLVRVGTRLQVRRADHVARSVASRYTLDAFR